MVSHKYPCLMRLKLLAHPGCAAAGSHGYSGVSVIVGNLLRGYGAIIGIVGGYCIPDIWIVRFLSSIVSHLIA
jgi:hypothetical protein